MNGKKGAFGVGVEETKNELIKNQDFEETATLLYRQQGLYSHTVNDVVIGHVR